MLTIPDLLKPYVQKPVAIFGNGISGKAVASLLDNLKIDYLIYDNKKQDGAQHCLDFSDESSEKHSLVIFSPGFPLDHPWLILARKKACYSLTELDFAALFWKGKIIAITGTNGKSTLTKLLTQALLNLGLNGICCGNIGDPLSAQHAYFNDINAIAVCEVSSFQAEALYHFSPDALLWTNFDEDHLDRHGDLKKYFTAKWTLIHRLKSDLLFIGKSVKQFADQQEFYFPKKPFIVDESLNKKDNIDKDISESIFSASPQLENYLHALYYWKVEGYDYEILKNTALTFKPLRHRLAITDEIEGKIFWNDSKGTNFLATIEALKFFDDKVLWIGGGKYKGGDLEAFVKKISPFIEEAFLIGQTAERLAILLELRGVKAFVYPSLDEAVEKAFEKGLSYKFKNIVFSPGFSSYDMFSNAEERGNFFEKYVLELKRKQKALQMTL